MKTYLITYDLIRPETSPEYIRFFNAIKSHLAWAKLLRSVWLVKTNRSRDEIMALLKAAADENDKILAIEVTNGWIARNLPPKIIAWMKEGL